MGTTTTTVTTVTNADGTTTTTTTTTTGGAATAPANSGASQAEHDAWAQVVTKAWSDPQFAKELEADPHKVLAAFDMPIPAGVTVQVHLNGNGVQHYVVPEKPQDLSVDEASEQLLGDANPGF
ncbi:MAG: hypothetical protein KDK70_43820 [Myxococcales bacterium]|nr:hypothetical protein [Myxococcales bacterium]MCB9526323.1 hypothetical protein [Myxococcales bacterium]